MRKILVLITVLLLCLFYGYYKSDRDICFNDVHGQTVRYHWLNGCQIQWGDGSWQDLSTLGGGI